MRAVLRVTEIFHSIQGESSRAGLPFVFIRLSGCNLRCVWCDTAYAFHGGRSMTVEEVADAAGAWGCPRVLVTGGEPLMQEDAIALLESLVARGYEVCLETGGSLPIETVPAAVARIVDVKCPGSGESGKNRWRNLDDLRPRDEVKFVLAGREDYDWAREVVRDRGLAELCPVLFSPVHGTCAPGDLARWVLDDRLPVRVQIQLHKVLWPGVTRGV